MRDAFFQKLERHVTGLFDMVRLKAEAAGEEFCRAPYTEERIWIRGEAAFPLLTRGICLALVARESFRQDAPLDVPELPLAADEYEKLISSKSSKFAVVGYFGRSWACANWGPHPTFRDYVCGLMACEHTPASIRGDPKLLKEFPPKPLAGLDQALCWGTRDRIFDFTQQLMRAEESWRRCGMADDAKWMRGVLERIMRVELDQKLRDFLDSQPDRRT